MNEQKNIGNFGFYGKQKIAYLDSETARRILVTLVMKSIYHCILHSNSLSNEMDKFLLDVRGLPINIL